MNPPGESFLLVGPDLVIDLPLHKVSVRGRPAAVGLREFELLALLARHPNTPLRSDRIMQEVWGASAASPKIVAVAVHRLRSKIEIDPERPEYVATVRGYGYKLVDNSHSHGPARSHKDEMDEMREIIEALVLSALSGKDAGLNAVAAETDRARLIAGTLQRSMLLKPPENGFKGITLDTTYVPCWDEAEVGGDFFDAFALEKRRVALAVGDVAGKGLQAAARTLEMKYALRAFLQSGRSLSAAMGELNNFAFHSMSVNGHEDQFVAMTVVALDTGSGMVEYVTAGSLPPLVIRSDGPAQSLPERPGMLLGVERESVYPTTVATLGKGDAVILATDGITEARTGSAFLNSDGLVCLAEDAARSRPFAEIGQAILEGARAFAGGELRDDACLLLARWD